MNPSFTTIDRRAAPPSEIELRPATACEPARMISETDAVRALREANTNEIRLAGEIEKAARQRADAIVIQEQRLFLGDKKHALESLITLGGNKLASVRGRITESEAYIFKHWTEKDFEPDVAANVSEILRSEFLLKLLPTFVEKYQSELEGVQREIAEFDISHG